MIVKNRLEIKGFKSDVLNEFSFKKYDHLDKRDCFIQVWKFRIIGIYYKIGYSEYKKKWDSGEA